jgi:hypothetical protein
VADYRQLPNGARFRVKKDPKGEIYTKVSNEVVRYSDGTVGMAPGGRDAYEEVSAIEAFIIDIETP